MACDGCHHSSLEPQPSSFCYGLSSIRLFGYRSFGASIRSYQDPVQGFLTYSYSSYIALMLSRLRASVDFVLALSEEADHCVCLSRPFSDSPTMVALSMIISEVNDFFGWYFRSGQYNPFLPHWFVPRRITFLEKGLQEAKELLMITIQLQIMHMKRHESDERYASSSSTTPSSPQASDGPTRVVILEPDTRSDQAPVASHSPQIRLEVHGHVINITQILAAGGTVSGCNLSSGTPTP